MRIIITIVVTVFITIGIVFWAAPVLTDKGDSCGGSATLVVYDLCKAFERCDVDFNGALREDCREQVVFDYLSG